MITKWLWTFGVDTKWSNGYVVINGDEELGRKYVFHKYGQESMAMDYPYEIGMKNVVEKYHLELLEEAMI